MRYAITHQTAFEYGSSVSVSHHIARLTPRGDSRQQCLACELQIDPSPALTEQLTDYFGNATTIFTVEGAHRQLRVTARSTVEVSATSAVDPQQSVPWESLRDQCLGDRLTPALEAGEFAFDSPLVERRPAFADYATESFTASRPLLDGVHDLTRRIHADFKFDPVATTIATPLEQVFKHRRGVCQDFAHFQIACLRSLGLPARYVSGYLETAPPPGKPRLQGADASHAWVAVYCPEHGWLEFDPTNNLVPSDRHITVACGRDYSDVSPLRGVIVGGGKHRLKVAVDVLPV